MEERLFTTLERASDSAFENQPVSERLEFGKFCVSSDGPIETNRDRIPIEHSQLGWSVGFPRDLISNCHPSSLGISREGAEPLPEEPRHGTVLRPVVHNNQIRSVFYRVRSRAEDGEGQGGRRYTLARYLVVPSEETRPLTMYSAMQSDRLRGLTRRDALELAPLVLVEQELKLDTVGEAFLRAARVYVLSGVPISITEEIAEEQFFTLVSLLYERLPRVLRPHVSAGWNVGSSYSGTLGITYSNHRAANAALFSPSTLAWSPPECMRTWNERHEPVVSSYDSSRLEPGRLFQRYVTLSVESGARDQSVAADGRLATLVDSLPSINLPELPDWHDPATVRLLRYPGLQARDQFAITALSRWLSDNVDHPRLIRDARQLTYRVNRLKALDLILEALSQPASRERADDALWRSVNGKAPELLTNRIKGANGPGADRARLFVALGSSDVSQTLGALCVATGNDSERLPAEAVASLERILDESLNEANRSFLLFHKELLASPPSHYRDWINKRALELMRVLALEDAAPNTAYEAITVISNSNEASALHEFLKGVVPTEALIDLVGSLRSAARQIFLEVFNHRWFRKSEETAARREELLGWFHALKPEEPTHPLLRMYAGKQLHDSEVSAIGDEVEQRHVPPSLFPQIAVVALERWPVLGRRILSDARAWCEVTRLWPVDHARILGGIEGQKSPSPAIMNAAANLRPSFSDINAILSFRMTSPSFRRDAPVLWNWATCLPRRVVNELTLLDLCVYISAGELPPGTSISDDELRRFIDFAQMSNGLRLSSEVVQRMWAAATERWQTELLLSLFPKEDFQPSASQQGLWVQKRKWLIDHLNGWGIDGRRRNRFYVATQPFQSLSYLEDQRHWDDGFLTSGIWGAFRRVPVTRLPQYALRHALRDYTSSNWGTATAYQAANLIDRQADMCLEFIRGYVGRDGQSSASRIGALKIVMMEFLLSALHCRDEAVAVEVFFDTYARMPNSTLERKRQYFFSRPIMDLLMEIAMFSDHKFVEKVISAYYKERRNRDRR